nr:hypothetical protein CFP56_71674 [Quercus suber]
MLTRPNTSGFGWDILRKCVVAENDVWDAYVQLKVHHLIDPYVEELEVEKNYDKLDNIHEDVDYIQIPTSSSNAEDQNARKKKRRIQNGEDNMVEVMKEVAIILAAQLKDASNNLSKGVIGVLAAESWSKINEELLKLLGLTTKERHKATKLIACQHELIDVFLSMLDVEKE